MYFFLLNGITYTDTCTNWRAYMHACMHVCVFTYILVFIYVYIHILCVRMNIYIDDTSIYIYICMGSQAMLIL